MSINMKFNPMIVVACLILRFIIKLRFPQNCSNENKKKRKRGAHMTTAHAKMKFGDGNLRRMTYQSSSLPIIKQALYMKYFQ